MEERIKRLSKREKQILELIIEGYISEEIALKLLISYQTVKNHITNIILKLNAKNRTHAAILYYKSKEQKKPILRRILSKLI